MVKVKCFDPDTGEVLSEPAYEDYVTDAQIEKTVSGLHEQHPEASIEVIYNT